MSSTTVDLGQPETTANAAAPAARKVPVPCWTHEETLTLINAYRQRWIALRRGYLRSADWDAVAAAIPSKSSDQCRHKMEKLRQRYRAEKQRSAASPFPGKFFSAWIFFKVLAFLDDGTSAKKGTAAATIAAPAVALADNDYRSESGEGFLLTARGDRKYTFDMKNFEHPNSGHRRNIHYPEENLESRLKKRARTETDPDSGHRSFNHDDGARERFNFDKVSTCAGYPGRNLIIDLDIDGRGLNLSGGVSGKLHSSKTLMPKNMYFDNYANDHSGGDQGGGRSDPVAEMAASIKQLGEGFLKMEKMRMEMAVEFEKARMEVELKRNEMIMESQRRIVDAFMKVAKAKKAKKEVCVAET